MIIDATLEGKDYKLDKKLVRKILDALDNLDIFKNTGVKVAFPENTVAVLNSGTNKQKIITDKGKK